MAEQPAPVKQLRPLDVAQATRGLFACCASGDATALLQLLDTCVLVDHTAKELDDCQPVSADLRRDEDGATALLVACEGGHVECTNLLIQRGCPPGKASRTGRTPVMAASFHGHPDCLKLLLAARASPYDGTMQDDKGSERTPLVLALDRFSTTGDDTCVKQLLRADERLRAAPAAGGAGGGADAAAARALRAEADAYYASALVTSCGSGLTEGVRLLLQARVDPNVAATSRLSGGAKQRFSVLPLQAAASAAQLECVELLLAAGAAGRPGSQDDAAAADGEVARGKSAEEVARELGHAACADAIRASDAARDLVGQRVQLAGLKKSELNGRRGVAREYHSAKKRLAVALTPLWNEPRRWRGAAEPLLLKPENLHSLGPAPQRGVLPCSGTVLAAALVALVAVASALPLFLYPLAAMPLDRVAASVDAPIES